MKQVPRGRSHSQQLFTKHSLRTRTRWLQEQGCSSGQDERYRGVLVPQVSRAAEAKGPSVTEAPPFQLQSSGPLPGTEAAHCLLASSCLRALSWLWKDAGCDMQGAKTHRPNPPPVIDGELVDKHPRALLSAGITVSQHYQQEVAQLRKW